MSDERNIPANEPLPTEPAAPRQPAPKKKRERRPLGSVYFKRYVPFDPSSDGVWKVRLPTGRRRPNGRPSYSFRTVASKAEGERVLREAAKLKRKGLLQVSAPTRQQGAETLDEGIGAYIAACRASDRAEGTLEQYAISAKGVRESGLGSKTVGSVTADDIRAYLVWRKANVWRGKKGGAVKVAGATASATLLARDRSLLATVFRWLMKEGRASANPVLLVAAPPKRDTERRPFTDDELRAFQDVCKDANLRRLFLTAVYTGLGGSELIRLCWENLDLSGGTIHITRKKTGKKNVHPMNPHLLAELKRHREERAREAGIPDNEDAVFLSRYGTPFRSFPREAWRTAIRRAGLPGNVLKPHSLRKTFATAASKSGTSIMDVSEMLGHASIGTTQRYLRGSEAAKRRAVESLDFGLAPAAPPDAPAQGDAATG